MVSGFDLNQIILFPVKDAEARKHFLIGCLVALAAMIIPIVPYFILIGYAVAITRQVMNNEAPHMVPWDNWGDLFKDGLKVFAVRFVYSLPIIVLFLPMFISFIAFPLLIDGSNNHANGWVAVLVVIMSGSLCLLFPLSLAISLIVPAAEMHAVDKKEFAAGFRLKEWWEIFRANTSGFITAFVIFFAVTFIINFIFQILAATIILACLLPLMIPVLMIYSALILYVTAAIAYRDGKSKLSQAAPQPA